MKLKVFSAILCAVFFSKYKSQTVLLNEGFESYPSFSINNFGNWTTLDLDGLTTRTLGGDPAPPTSWYATWQNAHLPQAYQIFEPSVANVTNDPTGATGEIRNFDPHSGNKYVGSWAGEMVQSFEGNKDWLISPQITLGSSGNQLSLWVKTLSNSYGDERFRIGIFTGSGNPTSSADFTIISPNYSATDTWQYAYGYWTERILSLDVYAGQTVKIGVYCLTQQGSMLMIDDFKVTTTGSLSTSETNSSEKIKIAPNPTSDFIEILTEEKIMKYEIFDFSGKSVLTGSEKKINVMKLPSGSYMIKIFLNNGKTNTHKFVKNDEK